jgi:hypothetical protein
MYQGMMRCTMWEDNLSVIAGRLAALERRVRWYHRLTLALAWIPTLGKRLNTTTV